jgi:4-amino-4-deoxychorismate lyase
MFQWVESIWIHDGVVPYIDLHQSRYERTLAKFYEDAKVFNIMDFINVKEHNRGEFKCRFLYSKEDCHIEIQPYVRRDIRTIKIIHTTIDLDYSSKRIDRKELDYYYSMKGDSDEIIMVKDNLITDGYYYNLVFENDGAFYTPTEPLLRGVMRQSLIDAGEIIPIPIHINDLYNYQRVHLINALNPLGQHILDINQIV